MHGSWVTALVAIVAAAIGGIGKDLSDLFRERRKHRTSGDATVAQARIVDRQFLTNELWDKVEKLQDRVDELHQALENASREQLELLRRNVELEAEHAQLQRAHDDLERKHEALQAELDQLRNAG